MNKIKYNSKTIIAILTIIMFCTTILINKYVIAAGNDIIVTAPTTVEEGSSITFNVSFGNSISNIWLSDGDVIKRGFSGTVKVNKITNNKYTIVISNVSGVGTEKYIVINSGVGYVNNTPTSAVSSNVFSITAKKKKENNNSSNNNNNNSSTKSSNSNYNNNTKKDNNSSNTNNTTNNSSNTNNTTNTANNSSKTTNNIATNNSTNVAKSSNNNTATTSNVTDTSKINTTENNKDKTENKDGKEDSKETKKVLREIPNTGKI